jgi:hypothetical protein
MPKEAAVICQIDLPPLTTQTIKKVVSVIECWKASHGSAVELIAALYPVLLEESSVLESQFDLSRAG